MAKSGFVISNKYLNQRNVATLALKQEELKRQIDALKVELDQVEAQMRTTVGLGFSMAQRAKGEWIEVTVKVEPRPMLSKERVLALVGEKKMPLCYADTNQNRIYVKRVDAKYVKENY